MALGLCDQASYASRVTYLTKCRTLACQRLEGVPAFCLDTVQASAIRGVRNRRCDFKQIDRESRIGGGDEREHIWRRRRHVGVQARHPPPRRRERARAPEVARARRFLPPGGSSGSEVPPPPKLARVPPPISHPRPPPP